MSAPVTEKARRLAEEREKRLAEALRANLRRRKSQARARAEEGEEEPSQGDMPEAQEADAPASPPSA